MIPRYHPHHPQVFMAKLKPRSIAELAAEKAEHELAAVQHQAWADDHEGAEHRARVALAQALAGAPGGGREPLPDAPAMEALAIINAKLQHHHQAQAWQHARAAKRCRQEIEDIFTR